MSRLMLIQNASDSISPPSAAVDAHADFAPPGGGARTPAPQPQHVLKFDRADQVDDGAAHHPDRVRFVEAQGVHVVLADVLDEARGGIQPQPAAAVDVTHPQRPAALKHRGVPIGNGHQRFVQRHQAGPAMAGTFSGARLGDTHAAAPRDGVTTLRWPGLPGRLPRWRTLADIDGGRGAGPPPRRTRVNPRCGESTSRLDTESSSIGQSVDDFSAGQIRNGTRHCGGPVAGHKGSHLPELHQRGGTFPVGRGGYGGPKFLLRDSMCRGVEP